MTNIFPRMRAVPMSEVKAGEIISFQRHGSLLLALTTDRGSNGARALVLLNRPIKNSRQPVMYVENWADPETVLAYDDSPRFEIDEQQVDPNGRRSWEIPGVLVVIGEQIFIRAYQEDSLEEYKLVEVQTGSVFAGRQPNSLWSFLSWELWIRDPGGHDHRKLLDFQSKGHST